MLRKKRCFVVVLILTLVFSSSAIYVNKQAYAENAKDYFDYQEIVGTYSVDSTMLSYTEYIAAFPNTRPESVYTIDAEQYVRYEENGTEMTPEIFENYKSMDGASIYTKEDALIEYEVDIKEVGFYNISLLYYPIEGKSSEIQRSVFIDGELPYNELALVEFYRIWRNQVTDETVDEKGVSIRKWDVDNQGNDLKPTMVEMPDWINSYIYDSNGYIMDELSVYLDEGVHTISFLSMREPMLLRSVTLKNADKIVDYAAKKSEWDANGYNDSQGKVIRIEAENASRTSSQMLYPIQDQSSSSIYPASAKELKNNAIGGNAWRMNGQWIEWDFEVEQNGYYYFAMHAKQNFQKGIYVSRKITIDGQVPFSEFSQYGFGYKQKWREEILSDASDTPYKVYLEEGMHTLRMENVLGDFANIVSQMQDVVYELNGIYRKVIRIIGVSPDVYRDYQIEASLPELKGELIGTRDKLDLVIEALRNVAGERSDRENVLITMRDQLNELIKDQERFAKTIGSFKTNNRACGNWINEVIFQPLQLDTIYFYSPNEKVSIGKVPWYSNVTYEIQRVFNSFVIDYSKIGNIADEKSDAKTISLWVGTGRDQANSIKSLIDKDFTSKFGISVNVMLVDMGTLLQATLAGQGPDVAIQVGNDLPMNYGLRNAVADLRQFDDLDVVKEQFNESAMVALEFDNHTYGLPETQTFPMMFYRKDILKELNISLPKTWDDVKVIMTVFAKNQMEFGMLPSEQVFASILYQSGGEYYNESSTLSALDSDEAINAFKTYCNYYTDYKLDKATSVEQRFRTGETPIIIADYTLYNNLQVSAPDLKGLWGFAPIPGTTRDDGTIDKTVASGGQACVILNASKDKDSAWEFLKWWTSADTQTMYGREMESLMGASARVATANMVAFANLPWPLADFQALEDQFENTRGIPQIPGGYFTFRNVNNAFFKVTSKADTVSPREELMDKILLINDEIRYKRIEFGLPMAE